MMDTDVIIVGAGHNGLVAAVYLARAGLRVAIFERPHVDAGEYPRGTNLLEEVRAPLAERLTRAPLRSLNSHPNVKVTAQDWPEMIGTTNELCGSLAYLIASPT